MKLYTENQMKDAIIESFLSTYPTNGDDILSKFTPIKLPSDEEILRVALKKTNGINEQVLFNNGAVYVCRLIEEQIKQQNNA